MAQKQQKALWQNKAFALYADSVVQQKFTGKALSATELTSNYKSPANEFLSPAITFKFSINGKDNEMSSGNDHHFNCMATDGKCETPIVTFGKQFIDTRDVPDNTFVKPNTQLTVRVDMNAVLQAFEKDGYYTTYKGDKIYKADFKGVYVAGMPAPLSWDFDNLANKPELKLEDKQGNGIYEGTLSLNNQQDQKQTASGWKLSKDIAAYPRYHSPHILADALYNMALEEMEKAVEPDSTFRTGKEWAGVWTRDISYSIILSMAYLQPQVAKYSLLRKVKNGRIIQDTGTGGAWPCSTDRMIWAVAAFEVYKATGDEAWLRQAYEIVKNSVDDDLHVAYDKTTGLMKGESSFLDWRDQTYPKWMQPADIYESECLGTNAVHYQANTALSEMAALLGDKQAADQYKKVAASIRAGVNSYLWMSSKGYYAQYLYGRNNKIVSPHSEALGEALTVLFGIASPERAKQVLRNTPVMDFGIPCIYPQIPNMPPYHNNAVWPFVQSYWALAAAKAGNEAAVMHSIAAIYRPAALWTTNKENFVASNGDFAGTVINSSNMLWSLSGSIALVHKLLFGIHLNAGSLSFRPFVPYALRGKRSLANFSYRKTVLDIELNGYGNSIKSFTIDGKASSPVIPATLTGRHQIKIQLANKKLPTSAINSVKPYTSLDVPVTGRSFKNNLVWNKVNGAVHYKLLKNGKQVLNTTQTSAPTASNDFAEWQVIAVDKDGVESFASEPVVTHPEGYTHIYEAETFAPKSPLTYEGYSGEGFIEVSKSVNTSVTFTIDIPSDGIYSIDVSYANGNGPINTENKCAIRTLKEADKALGTIVLPQRGKDEWSNWGWSNAIHAAFTKGKHTLTLSLEPYNENMNGDINQAMLDFVRVMKVNK